MSDDPRQVISERASAPKNEAVLANVSLLYYKDGLTQNEIAQRLGVSRATVVNYLRQAREQNIVDIRINGTSFAASKLSKDLRDAYGLDDVYVASIFPGPDSSPEKLRAYMRRQVARVGAMALYDLLQPGDILGVAWGETIQWLSEEMPHGAIRDLTVCQMIGSMKSPLLPAAETSSIRIASSVGADCHTLHVPAILSSREIAAALRAEPIIQSQLRKLAELTMAVFSVGNLTDTTHMIRSGMVSAGEMRRYRERGAVGDLCGRFIDADGNHVAGELDERMFGIMPEDLRRLRGVLVVSGPDKTEATRAALRGGYAKYLIIDEVSAKLL